MNRLHSSTYRARRIKDNLVAYLFLSPALITFIVFVGIPLFSTVFYLAFTKYNIIEPVEFIGFQNFIDLFQYPVTWTIFMNTLKYSVVLLPLHVVIGLFLAIAVNSEKNSFLKSAFRTAIYLPSMATTAAVAVAWTYIYNKDFGIINYFLGMLGVEPIAWLGSSKWSIPTVALFSIWKFVGNSFLFFFIGLQNIPTSYYESARIDGANKHQVLFNITLPLLSPTIFFVITTTMIGVLQIFDEPYVLTKGGPGDSSRTVALFIYEKAFKAYDMGFASAIAFTLFFLILVLTFLQFMLQKKWVNYDYE